MAPAAREGHKTASRYDHHRDRPPGTTAGQDTRGDRHQAVDPAPRANFRERGDSLKKKTRPGWIPVWFGGSNPITRRIPLRHSSLTHALVGSLSRPTWSIVGLRIAETGSEHTDRSRGGQISLCYCASVGRDMARGI
ncbi:unnamed protein product [Calypogeia fissa]